MDIPFGVIVAQGTETDVLYSSFNFRHILLGRMTEVLTPDIYGAHWVKTAAMAALECFIVISCPSVWIFILWF